MGISDRPGAGGALQLRRSACVLRGILTRTSKAFGRDEVLKMAAKDRISQAGEAVRTAQRNRYLQRLVQDEDLRGSLIAAYGAARNAYGRM